MAGTRPAVKDAESLYSALSVMQAAEDDDGQLTPLCHPNAQAESTGSFFSRVKQTISSSPLGNILGHNAPNSSRSNVSESRNDANSLNVNQNSQEDLSAPTPRRLSFVKHVFTPMPGRSRTCTVSSTQSDASTDFSSHSVCASSSSPSCFSPTSLSSMPTLATSAHDSDNDDKWSPVLTSPSDAQNTPPETPDLVSNATTTSNSRGTRSQRSASISIQDASSMSTSSDNKKGKNPAPPFPYDTLIADITSPTPPSGAKTDELDVLDDNGEWWGLEYTLELSRRDSRTSDTSTSTTGEHSKSRESWAAIHQGSIPPTHEDDNFQDWQHWHQALDKMELRRRRKRTIDFIEESGHLASLYLDEKLAQRAVQLHEDLLTEDELYDALVWIEYAAERRPDPYFPPEKHNLGWVLKNNRSVACLNELQKMLVDDD